MKKHLSLWGIGPFYVGSIGILTALFWKIKPRTKVPRVLKGLMAFGGVCALILGAVLWISAVRQDIRASIRENRLETNGVYAWVRNPVYAAFMFAFWGLLLVTGNLFIVPAIPLYLFLMTFMLKRTEEKWLMELYGPVYRAYCQKVNRCLPFGRF